jgi:preprotein translocase subunit SecE
MAEEKEKISFKERIKKFFRDYKSEFKKISWPNRKETTKRTIMVIAAIVVISVCIFVVDLLFTSFNGWLAQIF